LRIVERSRHDRHASQSAILITMTPWYSPAEILVMATAPMLNSAPWQARTNAYLGKLGVIETDAMPTRMRSPAKKFARLGRDLQ
jgi:hypothetical protein